VAIAALLSEPTVSAAAEKAGVSEVTLWRWQNQPAFKAAFRLARREAMEKATAFLQQSSWAAGTTLVRLLGSPSDSVKLRAATEILNQANKGLEMLDHEERLAALEELAAEQGGRR